MYLVADPVNRSKRKRGATAQGHLGNHDPNATSSSDCFAPFAGLPHGDEPDERGEEGRSSTTGVREGDGKYFTSPSETLHGPPVSVHIVLSWCCRGYFCGGKRVELRWVDHCVVL